ncbi:MAG: methyltransferase domain-containing protein [Acidimicrobiales bacterium]
MRTSGTGPKNTVDGSSQKVGGPSGSRRTQLFYDEQGWTENDGQLIDLELFGTKEDGPIRIELHETFQQRIHDAIATAGSDIDLLECGCGGSPEVSLLDLCSTYTGIDFSDTGLKQAARQLEAAAVIHDLQKADVCNLPFADDRFDAVYSARMIFHIPDPAAQARAVSEMLRVVKPGGVAVIITANPFPLLFPERSLKRIVALTPVLGPVANRLRPTPPLPYEPMSLRWFKRQIGDKGAVDMISNGLPSTAFNQRVSEFSTVGKRLWQLLRWVEISFPRGSVPLGNYTQITVTKH